ncbi:hypothetical protein SSKA14_2744 [Stenotrophomonas sp. SKA14]|nr:hypothetical protein SSKA14_2744 [Stenotrophomonas sp. SKA14]
MLPSWGPLVSKRGDAIPTLTIVERGTRRQSHLLRRQWCSQARSPARLLCSKPLFLRTAPHAPHAGWAAPQWPAPMR